MLRETWKLAARETGPLIADTATEPSLVHAGEDGVGQPVPDQSSHTGGELPKGPGVTTGAPKLAVEPGSSQRDT